MKSRMAAPATAVTREPARPLPAEMPTRPNRKPPTTAPMMPTAMLPSRPEPPPGMRSPASQPATAPMARKMSRLVISIAMSSVGST